MSEQTSPAASPLAAPEPWNLVADAYVAELLPQFEPFAHEALKLAELPAFPRIADVATGPGTLALLAAARGATVSALDFSTEMIARLRRRVAEAGLSGIEAHVGDGQSLPFAEGSFDSAFSMFGLMFFPDRAAGFRELRRVLRPRGRAVVSSWQPFQGPFVAMMESLAAELPNLPLKQGAWPLGAVDEFAQEMTSAGFSNVAIHTVTHHKSAPSAAEFWASVQRTMAPVVLLRHRLGEERWGEIAARIFDRLKAEIGDGPVDLAFTANLGVGVK